MTWLIDIQEQLQDTYATIARLERAIAKNPTSRSLILSAKSLRKRQARLESDFAIATEQLGRVQIKG